MKSEEGREVIRERYLIVFNGGDVGEDEEGNVLGRVTPQRQLIHKV